MVDKVRENRLRRAAKRQGLLLVKSRRRDPFAYDFGLYVLVPDEQQAASAFAHGKGVTLDEVERSLG